MWRLFFCFLLLGTASPENNRDAQAIVFRLQNAREKIQDVEVRFRWKIRDHSWMKCRLEYSDNKIRSTVTDDGGGLVQSAIMDSSGIWDYRPRSDLCRSDLRNAGVVLTMCLDPRTLGLSSAFTPLQVTSNLLTEGVEKFEWLGMELIEGVNVAHVRVHRSGLFIDYWINEPTARLYRKRILNAGDSSQIDEVVLNYANSKPDWLPSTIQVNSNDRGSIVLEQIELVESSLDTSRFHISTMDIPVGTAVIDNVAKRRLGYWTGKDIREDYFERRRDIESPKSFFFGWRNICILLLLICAVAVFLVRRSGSW
jgi:hypothetical protein